MKTKKPNAELVCKQFEDALAPCLRLYTIERAVYYHLLRHSRLEGKTRLHFSVIWLARNLCLSQETVRKALRGLVRHRALLLVHRSKAGHVMDVCLPEEVPAARVNSVQKPAGVASPHWGKLEEIDFMGTRARRQAIHAREGGVCFYCLRVIGPGMQGLAFELYQKHQYSQAAALLRTPGAGRHCRPQARSVPGVLSTISVQCKV